MAYTINLTNGTVLTTIADGTVNDTSTELVLIGKNYSGYGTFLNDNLVHLLENFSDSTAPTTPLTGQLWWDTAGNLKVYTGSTFKTLGATTSSTSAPSGAVTGNAWWDTTNKQLNLYDGSSWVLVGPASGASTGTSGALVGTILDSNASVHVAVNLTVAGTIVGIYSKDSVYTPGTAISGFNTIKPGFNLSTDLAGAAMWGTASNADQFGNVGYANYARTDIAETFDNTVAVNNNSGFTVGTNQNFAVSIGTGNVVQLTNNIQNTDFALRANVGGSIANAVAISGSSGAVTVTNAVVVSGNISTANYLLATKGDDATSSTTGAVRVTGGMGLTGNVVTAKNVYANNLVITNGITAATLATSGNITSSANVIANYLVGTAIQAQYADLAERFAADDYYTPGTVLTLGGEAEVTVETEELSDDVFGVVSTSAAYLMNAGAGANETHPPVAVSGRVPVNVVGTVRKGDRLVSAGNGYARAAAKNEVTPFNVIGRALENKLSGEKGTVMAIVKLNS